MKNKILSYGEKCIINFDYVTHICKEDCFIVIDFVNGTNVKIPCDKWELEKCYNLYLDIMTGKRIGPLVKKYNKEFEIHNKETEKGKEEPFIWV